MCFTAFSTPFVLYVQKIKIKVGSFVTRGNTEDACTDSKWRVAKGAIPAPIPCCPLKYLVNSTRKSGEGNQIGVLPKGTNLNTPAK